jgi:hypothetical protein
MPGNKGEIRWWPHYLLKLAGVMVVVVILLGIMASAFPVPDKAPEVIPMPDDGANVPGPEWVFTLFWTPFWYLKGRLKKYLFLMPLATFLAALILILLPYFHKIPLNRLPGLKGLLSKARSMQSGLLKSFVYAVPSILFAIILGTAVFKSGHQAKILGCDSCHHPAMGHRMAIPPVDVFKYYSVDRARQIGVGKYRAGKSTTAGDKEDWFYQEQEAEGYKDANWQMRHLYEPTFTW